MSLRHIFIYTLLFLLPCYKLVGQTDSLNYSLTAGSIFSADQNLPLYSHSNIGGLFDYDFNGPYIRAAFDATKWNNLKIGGDLLVANQSQTVILREVYASYQVGPFSFFAGKKDISEQQRRPTEPGSFGISNNARPIPKVGVSFPDFWTLPFAGDLIAIKGSLFHGWFEGDRFIDAPFLHEKSVYLRIGDQKVYLEGGLNHYAIWGGTNTLTNENLDSDFSDFFTVFTGGGKESVTNGEQNGLGSHLGYYDFQFNYHFKNVKIEVYHHAPFEDGKSFQVFDLNDGKDRIVGLNLKFQPKSNFKLNTVSFQYMTSKIQGGPGLPDGDPAVVNNFGYPFGGRDDIYNNFLYRDGWTNFDRTIGSPLFIDRALSEFYFGLIPDYEVAIVNNRINSFHIGLSGQYKDIDFRFLSTFTKNFGTYAGLYEGRFAWDGIQTNPNFEYTFLEPLKQAYFLLEVASQPFKNKNIDATMSMAYDRGQITDNLGISLSIAYNGILKYN